MSQELKVLNLGAGVQSTALALMSHLQVVPEHVPLFDCAIFADTQEEPEDDGASVYAHLQWLIATVAPSFPILVRTGGKLGDDLISGTSPSGTTYDLVKGGRFASIPAFTSTSDGSPGGMTRRQCTKEYKSAIIEKTIKRELLGLKPRQRVPKGVTVHQYVGLSFDEGRRIFGHSGRPGTKARIEANAWALAHFPLYDMFLTREALRGWLSRQNIPHEVPRSACTFCPFHSNAEWARMKERGGADWARAVTIDDALRTGAIAASDMVEELFLHRSCVPLRMADLSIPDPSPKTEEMNFSMLECEGMCGV